MPDPTPPVTYTDGWTPPGPAEMPEWRTQQIEDALTRRAALALTHSVGSGSASLAPLTGSPEHKGSRLAEAETDRLRNADLYYATADMTALALNCAQETPIAPISPRRIPSPYGFMLFAEPIASYRCPAAYMRSNPMHELIENDVYVPIVACSWGPLEPTLHGIPAWEAAPNINDASDHAPVAPRPRTRVLRQPGTWITLYTYSNSLYDTAHPDKPIGYHPKTGATLTPRRVSELSVRNSPLAWDGEGLLAHDRPWQDPAHVMAQPYIARALNVIYTSWLMMTDPRAAKLVHQEEEPRLRAGRKRDRRDAITGDSTVRIITIPTSHRPATATAEEDAASSDGRRPPQWSCRWPVRAHRRNQYYPSTSSHEEILIYPYVKGPADKPLRIKETVRVWGRDEENNE